MWGWNLVSASYYINIKFYPFIICYSHGTWYDIHVYNLILNGKEFSLNPFPPNPPSLGSGPLNFDLIATNKELFKMIIIVVIGLNFNSLDLRLDRFGGNESGEDPLPFWTTSKRSRLREVELNSIPSDKSSWFCFKAFKSFFLLLRYILY